MHFKDRAINDYQAAKDKHRLEEDRHYLAVSEKAMAAFKEQFGDEATPAAKGRIQVDGITMAPDPSRSGTWLVLGQCPSCNEPTFMRANNITEIGRALVNFTPSRSHYCLNVSTESPKNTLEALIRIAAVLEGLVEAGHAF